MQEKTEKKTYTTPTLTTHGDVAKVTEDVIDFSNVLRGEWRPRQAE